MSEHEGCPLSDVPAVGDRDIGPGAIYSRADFARALTALRDRSGWTVREVATQVQVVGAHSTVGDWFAGRGLPSTSSQALFVEVLRVCGVDSDEVVEAWLQAWRTVRRAPGRRTLGPEPYRGLASFQPSDSDWFFGRGELTTALLDRLAVHRRPGGGMQMVVGASGSGKSSLLRAGAIPALQAGRLADSDRWTIVLFTPGEYPVNSLATSMSTARGTGPSDDGASVDELVGDQQLVLVVDQFEELFTLCGEETERRRFIGRLRTLATDGALVLLGLRADFYGHVLRYPDLLDVVAHDQVTVGPMSEAQLREAIVAPARKAKVDIEEGLVELLVREVAPPGERGVELSVTGALPLLSHALYSTWSHAQGKRLTIASYREIGGIDGAVAASADQVYDDLTDAQRELARQLFLTLVHVSADTADTRRRVPTGDLLARYGPHRREQVEKLLDLFVTQRLITVDSDAVEISHEALIRAWPTLRGWLDNDRAGLVIRQQLTRISIQLIRPSGCRDWPGGLTALVGPWSGDYFQSRTPPTIVGRG